MRAQVDVEYDPCRESIVPIECTQHPERLCDDYPDFTADEGWRFEGQTFNGPIPSNVTAYGNYFTGQWSFGISAANNALQEVVQIRDNTFVLDDPTWLTGIILSRSQVPNPTLTAHNAVADNSFDIGANCSTFTCIDIEDDFAEDELHVYNNVITVNDHQGPISGIYLSRGPAGNGIKIFDNTMTVAAGAIDNNNWGITVNDASDGATINHEINSNTVTGAATTSASNTLDEGFYLFSAKNFSLCQNAVDHTNIGFRFREINIVAFRENQMTHHDFGAWISNPPPSLPWPTASRKAGAGPSATAAPPYPIPARCTPTPRRACIPCASR